MDTNPQNLILLAYKGKALLMSKIHNAIDTTEHEWSFLACNKKNNEKLEVSIAKVVKQETNINIQEIEQITDNFYFARLTDENVNNIKRDEFQLLNFFTLKDVEKLRLNVPTKSFIQEYGNLI